MTLEQALAAYPFDPAHRDRPEKFDDLEKLRAFENPKMREAVYVTWANTRHRAESREPPPGFVPWDQRARRECVAPKNWTEPEERDE